MVERLTDAVHLVVGLALREYEQLGFESLAGKCATFREKHAASLEFLLLNVEPPDLVAINRDRLDGAANDRPRICWASAIPVEASSIRMMSG